MATLSDSDRTLVRRAFSGELSDVREACGLTKAELKAAVDGLDTWLNDNAAAANAAIPQPARGVLTSAQKARLLKILLTQRYLSGA